MDGRPESSFHLINRREGGAAVRNTDYIEELEMMLRSPARCRDERVHEPAVRLLVYPLAQTVHVTLDPLRFSQVGTKFGAEALLEPLRLRGEHNPGQVQIGLRRTHVRVAGTGHQSDRSLARRGPVRERRVPYDTGAILGA